MSKAWSKNIWIDPSTFGTSPACHILADMMNKDIISALEKHRVLSFINCAINSFKCISSIKDQGVRERVMVLMRDDLFARINMMIYHPKFLSHLKNVISYNFRRFLREPFIKKI